MNHGSSAPRPKIVVKNASIGLKNVPKPLSSTDFGKAACCKPRKGCVRQTRTLQSHWFQAGAAWSLFGCADLPAGIQSAKHYERKNAKLAGDTTLVAGIAGRYAIALFELARDENKLDETAQELTGLQALLDESEDFARLVRSPIFSAVEQTQAVAEIAQKAGFSPLTANFLKILAKNRRLFTLTGVIAGFRKLLADHRNELEADIASAVPLTDAQTEELKATLKAKTGKDISLNSRVDPALIGGLIVNIGSRMIDDSVRTKLNNLKMAMKEVG